MRGDDNSDGDVGAHQRFLTDPAIHKLVMSLVGSYTHSLHPDDDALDEVEVPELSRNNRVLLTNAIFEALQDILGSTVTEDDDLDEDEDDDEVASVGTEVARDKRMSEYYKAFMGKMPKLVKPWHSNKQKFVQMWMDLGNQLLESSPAKEPNQRLKLAVVTDSKKRDNKDKEHATVIGATSALPTKVARSITDMGFIPMDDAPDGDAAWVKSGSTDNQPDGQVILTRRDDDSYVIMYSKVNRYSPYGKVIKRQVLDDNASAEKIMRVITYMYELMTQE